MKVALSLSAIALVIGTTACSSPSTNNDSSSPAASDSSGVLAQAQEQTRQVPDQKRPELKGKATALMKVNGQSITIELDGTHAPVTVGNFIDLAQRGVYDGTRFHRVLKGPTPFVAQGGDPQSKDPNVPNSQLGTGNFVDPSTQTDRYIPLEIKPNGADKPVYSQTFEVAGIAQAPQLPHRKGAIAMARTAVPDSASAQFYFALSELKQLDGSYAVFGYVTDGMDAVEAIEQGDVIDSVEITSGADLLEK